MPQTRMGTAGLAILTHLVATHVVAAPNHSKERRIPQSHSTTAQAATGISSDAEILEQFTSRPDEPTRSFRARRHLEVTSGALGKRSWMDVQVDVNPQSGFTYRVIAAGGSTMLQERILHKVLRTEQDVYAAGDNSKMTLTADNYSFTPGGRDATGLVRLLAAARRKEMGLLNGQFLVTPDSADLVEVSGTMAKGPSFWIPQIDMTKRYARVQGHRVNVWVDSVSHVRLLGESRFTMSTEYESIDGDTVQSVGHLAELER